MYKTITMCAYSAPCAMHIRDMRILRIEHRAPVSIQVLYKFRNVIMLGFFQFEVICRFRIYGVISFPGGAYFVFFHRIYSQTLPKPSAI